MLTNDQKEGLRQKAQSRGRKKTKQWAMSLQGQPERLNKDRAEFLFNLLAGKKEILDSEKPFDLLVGEYWVKLRTSALRRGKDFNLTFSDVRKLMLKKKCEYTGAPLIGVNRTVDRLDPNKGYIKGNVYAVSPQANQAKNMLFESETSVIRMTTKEAGLMLNKLNKLGFSS